MYRCLWWCFLFCVICFFNCCKKAKDIKASCSYSSDVKKIITAKCALPACHGAGTSLPDFTDFQVLKMWADNGRVQMNVFELKIMPPANAGSLTAQEKETLKCWLDNGAAQN